MTLQNKQGIQIVKGHLKETSNELFSRKVEKYLGGVECKAYTFLKLLIACAQNFHTFIQNIKMKK